MNKFFIFTLISLTALAILAACGSVPFVAQNEPTATATRRAARPTFTPKPRATATAEIIPTEEPEATAEPEATEEAPTQEPAPVTKAPTKKPAPPKATNPPAPTEIPKPQFAINITSQFLCEQEGIYEIAVNAKKGKAPTEGIWFAAFDGGGRLLEDGAGKALVTATYPVSVSTAGNCKLSGSFENPVINNGKLDLVDPMRAGATGVVIRFVKSANDLTAISPDIPVNFGSGGRYWIYAQMQ